MQAKTRWLALTWTVYTWKNTSGHNLNVPSPNYSSDTDVKCITSLVVNMKILLMSPIPLSNNKNCSPFNICWYSIGKLGISALFIGLTGCSSSFLCHLMVLLKRKSFGKFTDAASNAIERAAARNCWGESSVSSGRSLIELLMRTTSQFVWDGAWVWLFVWPTMLSPSSTYILFLQWPFRRSWHWKNCTWFAKSFWKL